MKRVEIRTCQISDEQRRDFLLLRQKLQVINYKSLDNCISDTKLWRSKSYLDMLANVRSPGRGLNLFCI